MQIIRWHDTATDESTECTIGAFVIAPSAVTTLFRISISIYDQSIATLSVRTVRHGLIRKFSSMHARCLIIKYHIPSVILECWYLIGVRPFTNTISACMNTAHLRACRQLFSFTKEVLPPMNVVNSVSL
jgi:hypothetical protein